MPEFITRIWETWMAGGWVMIPLLALSLMIYSYATGLLVRLKNIGFEKVKEKQWTRWIERPKEAEGNMGEIIRFTQDEVNNAEEIRDRFKEVLAAELPPIDRRLTFLGTLVATAPLIGLLGTVFGMLVTFRALAVGGGQATDLMAQGISQALFPPAVGLSVALPGLIFLHLIRRKRFEYETFLARLESYSVQFWNQRPQALRPSRETRPQQQLANAV